MRSAKPGNHLSMSDTEDTNTSKEEQRLEKDIDKEINKLKYFLEETDELIGVQDYTEIKIAEKRAEMIIVELSDLVAPQASHAHVM